MGRHAGEGRPLCKADFTDADGERAAVLEQQFADLHGWDAESDAATLFRAWVFGKNSTSNG